MMARQPMPHVVRRIPGAQTESRPSEEQYRLAAEAFNNADREAGLRTLKELFREAERTQRSRARDERRRRVRRIGTDGRERAV
jgi:hypothetical protein